MTKTLYGREAAAKELGTTQETLRWAEKIGLIQPKRFKIGGNSFLVYTKKTQREIKEYLELKK